METPTIPKDTEYRFKQYLDQMATTLSSLTSRADQAENDRIQLQSLFKQLLGLLLMQQRKDINTAAGTDHQLGTLLAEAQRENASLMDQKRRCMESRVAKMTHVRGRLAASANSNEDRTRYEYILTAMEDMAADEQCKWDFDIMSHWFEAFTKPCTKCVSAANVGEARGDRELGAASADAANVSEAKGEGELGAASADAVNVGEAGAQDSTQSLVVRALELYSAEVRDHLSLRLKEVQDEISTLRHRHHASYMDDVERTLSALADIESSADVASIKEDVLRLRQLHLDVNTQYVICTIVDKTQEKYERAAHKPSWDALLLRITEFRDSNKKRNDCLLQAIIKLTTTMNRDIDAAMASTDELSRRMDALESEETRRNAQAAVQNLTTRLATPDF